jgi:hypothetical protein
VVIFPPDPSRWLTDTFGWITDRPVTAAAVLIVVVIARAGLDAWRHGRHAARARLVTIEGHRRSDFAWVRPAEHGTGRRYSQTLPFCQGQWV